jgi:hypothetical protein
MEGLGATLRVAQGFKGDSAADLATTAQESFVHAMDVTVLVAAGITLAGALVAAVWLPGKPSREVRLAHQWVSRPAARHRWWP